MGEFFKPWRRRFGVLTLLMACVFMGGWVRSQSSCDNFSFISDQRIVTTLNSSCGSILWMWYRLHSEESSPATGWNSLPVTQDVRDISRKPKYPFESVKKNDWGQQPEVQTLRWWLISYWLITIPLTLLSAFLLLSKPRNSIPKKITEPIPQEVN